MPKGEFRPHAPPCNKANLYPVLEATAADACSTNLRPRSGHSPTSKAPLSLREDNLIRATALFSAAHWNGVWVFHILCRITANFRATATRALLMPLRLARRIPQFFSADHWVKACSKQIIQLANAISCGTVDVRLVFLLTIDASLLARRRVGRSLNE